MPTKNKKEKNTSLHVYGLGVLIGLVVLAFGYLVGRQSTEIVALSRTVTNLSADVSVLRHDVAKLRNAVHAATNAFDVMSVTVGDQVAGMTVMETGPVDEARPFGTGNVRIRFSGAVVLSGGFIAHEAENAPTFIRFSVTDPKEMAKLPIIADPRVAEPAMREFDLDNSADALKALGAGSKNAMTPATIVIDGFLIERSGYPDGAIERASFISGTSAK